MYKAQLVYVNLSFVRMPLSFLAYYSDKICSGRVFYIKKIISIIRFVCM